MSEMQATSFSNTVDVQALQFEITGDSVSLLLYLDDKAMHECHGLGNGTLTNEFIKLSGTFHYAAWSSLDDAGADGVAFEAFKNGKDLIVDFYTGKTSGGLGQRLHVGQYKLGNVSNPKEMNVKGSCTFGGWDGVSERKTFKKD